MKTCQFCAEEIQDAAIVCKHCHRDLATGQAPTTTATVVVQQAPPWSKGVAAVLSLVIPGAGQIYKGQVANGIVWLIVVVVGYLFFILPGVVLHICCIVGAASGDPYKNTKTASAAPAAPTAPPLTDAEKKLEQSRNRKLLMVFGVVLALVVISALFFQPAIPARSTAAQVKPVQDDWGERLRQIIVSTGETCATVGDPFHQGMDTKTGTNFWNIRCFDGQSYAITMKANSEPRVLSCAMLKTVSRVDCFKTFTAQK